MPTSAPASPLKVRHDRRTDPLVRRYVDGVTSGRIVTCKYVRQAVERHLRDLDTGKNRDLWFDYEAAATALAFVQLLRHSKGKWAGQPLILEPWQAFIVACIFGWKKAAGTRRFNTAFVSVARKNGKSTLAAGVALDLLVADGEAGAEVYSAATKRDQAKIVHEEAKRMVRKSPCLRDVVTVLANVLAIEATDSTYKPLGADADTLDGLNPHGVIVDELHAHKTRAVWDVMESATGGRTSPLTLGITTAGSSGDQESIYWELKQYTLKVLAGVVDDDSWFGVIYTLDEGDSWEDESTWIKANPNLGVSVQLDDLRRKRVRCKATPAAVANFRIKSCNEDVRITGKPWLATDPGSAFDQCGGGDFYTPTPPHAQASAPPGPAVSRALRPETIEKFRGRDCWAGGDLSSISDLTSLCFAFPDEAKTECDLLCFCWCPRDNAVGRTRDARVPYLSWSDEGFLTLTEGQSVDYDCIREALRTARDAWGWNIREVAIDPNNARYLITKLVEDDGFNGPAQVIEHQQTTGHMNEPIGVTEKLVMDGKLRHGGHKVLRWCVSNCVIYQDTGGRRRFNKRAIREKIDVAVAAVMAVGRAMAKPVQQYARSIFDADVAAENTEVRS